MRGYFQANPPFDKSSVVAAFVVEFSFVRLGLSVETLLDPCWGIVQKSLLGGMDIYRRRLFRRTWICEFPCARTEYRQGCIRDALPAPRPAGQLDSLPWEPIGPQDKAGFGKEVEHHCLLYGPDATSSTQGSSIPFLNA